MNYDMGEPCGDDRPGWQKGLLDEAGSASGKSRLIQPISNEEALRIAKECRENVEGAFREVKQIHPSDETIIDMNLTTLPEVVKVKSATRQSGNAATLHNVAEAQKVVASIHPSGEALTEQVGGNHYKTLAIQPVEYCQRNGLGFIEGCCVKYVSRWKQKGGIDDLKKARHMLNILIEMEEAP